MTAALPPTAAAGAGTAVAGPSRRRRGRIALWSGLAVLVVFAVFVALLATVGSAPDSSPLLGKPAPAVSGPLLSDGKQVELSDYAGKWVLVNFAASWCVPCQLEMPQLESFDSVAPRMGATILTVTYDPADAGRLRSMLAGDHATWPAVHDAAAQVQWGIHAIPQSFLVDPDGIVVVAWSSEVQAASIESNITKLSAETTAAVGP